MPTNTTINNLKINKLTKALYELILNPSETELYLVPDETDSNPTPNSTNYMTSGDIYLALLSKANKSEMTITDGTGADADKVTILLKSGTTSTVVRTVSVMTNNLIDTIWNTVFPTLITFTIDSVSYQAEDGMTWNEWINSEYNTGNFIIYSSRIRPNMNSYINVSLSDQIQSNYNYVITYGGGSND